MSRSQTEGKLTVKNKPNYGINSLENTLRFTCLKKIPGCQKGGVLEFTQQPILFVLLLLCCFLLTFGSEIHIHFTFISTLLLHKSLFSKLSREYKRYITVPTVHWNRPEIFKKSTTKLEL